MLNLFAKKYIFSKKNTKAINVIAWISMSAIALGTAALIIVLSVFNGFGGFIHGLYNNFYTDIKISAAKGKTFSINENITNTLNANTNINKISAIYEDQILLKSGMAQSIVTLRGVDENYAPITGFNSCIKYGDSNLGNNTPKLIIGIGIANKLQVSDRSLEPLEIFAFNNDPNASLENAYTQAQAQVTGVFAVQDDFDNNYAVTNIENAQAILGGQNKLTALMVKLKNKNGAQAKAQLQNQLSKLGLIIETREEQNKTLNYILSSEKFMVYGVMTFMLLIAGFNVLASLSMLVMEKQKDINILRALGSSSKLITNIFLRTGLAIGAIGCISGLILGLLICWLQKTFGLVKIAGEGLLINAYPIEINYFDISIVVLTVFFITYLAAYLPSKRAASSKLWFGVR